MATLTTSASAPAKGRRFNGLPFIGPSVTVLLIWMIVPLVMTVWFSLQRYNLLDPTVTGFAGIDNYEFLVTDPDFWASLTNTLVLVGSVLVITVVGGTLLAVCSTSRSRAATSPASSRSRRSSSCPPSRR